MTDIIVIGAGVIGASVAFRLAQPGVRVVVLEADRPGGGASGTSFAWLNAARKKPHAYFDLNVAGMRAHHDLEAEFGNAPWLHRGGRLEWFEDHRREAADQAIGRLNASNYAGGWITSAEAAALEPIIDASVLPRNVAFFPDEAWIDPALFVGAMLAEAVRCGARVVRQRSVGVELYGGRVRGVVTADGARLGADLVINCAGAAVNEAAGHPALCTPMASTPGLLAFTQPAATTLSRIVATPECSLRPDGGGRLMLHSGAADAEAGVQSESTHEVAAGLIRQLQRLAPALGRLGCEVVRRVQRPVPADGYPVVGRYGGVEGYYVVVAHSGVTLAPLLGRLAAEEIAGQVSAKDLDPYRPDRFHKALGSPEPVAIES